MKKKHAIIVAGGSGTRMGAEIPKQFIEVNGKPILLYTLEKFYHSVPEANIIIVLPFQHHSTWNSILLNHNVSIPHSLAVGGQTRFQSVKNGLDTIQDSNALVAIHDGVRPLVNTTVILQSFDIAEKLGNAIASIKITDSVREWSQNESKRIDREKLRLIQTPQTFYVPLIKKAYKQPFSIDFTDDASVLEAIGEKINLFDGNSENIKITTPSDLNFLNFILTF